MEKTTVNKGIIYNQDADSLVWHVGRMGCTLTAEEMENYASQFKGSHMTDIMLCLNNTCSTFPSKTRTSLVDKYHQTVENGIEVDYKSVESIAGAHHIYEVLGIDHIEVEIRTFREIGINPWISFRMNDIHDLHLEASPILPDFYHEHPEVRRTKYHPSYMPTNSERAMDYTHSLVREHMLAFINESLDRYDPYGIELDYTREITVFADGYEHEGLDIMTAFVRDVYSLCKKYEEKYGHEIKLAVRVAPGLEQNYNYGLNVMEWVQAGMIDLVTLSGRFESNDTDMPIRLWKTMLSPYNVELAAGIEMNLRPHWDHKVLGPTFDGFAACAASAYSQGADKIYFYNYFKTFQSEPLKIDTSMSGPANESAGMNTVYSMLGDYDKTLTLDRSHIWSVNDRLPPWQSWRISGAQLPYTVETGRAFRITVGEIPDGAETELRIGFKDPDFVAENMPAVFVNTEECKFLGIIDHGRCQIGKVFNYSVPQTAHRANIYVYVLTEKGKPVTVDYIEAHIKAPK